MISTGVRTFVVRQIQKAEELFGELLLDTEHDQYTERAFLAAEAYWEGVWKAATFVTGKNTADQVASGLGIGGESAAEIKRRILRVEALLVRAKAIYYGPNQPQEAQR